MSCDSKEILFPQASWTQVEMRAEAADQQPWVYVNTTIALGLGILEKYWENDIAGIKTRLFFEDVSGANTFMGTVVDFVEVPSKNTALDQVTIDVDPDLYQSLLMHSAGLEIAATSLAKWFFSIRSEIDDAELKGKKVLINTPDEGRYRQIGLTDRVQA